MAGSHWLSILHYVIPISSLHFILPSPLHTSILFVWVSTPVLQIGTICTIFSGFHIYALIHGICFSLSTYKSVKAVQWGKRQSFQQMVVRHWQSIYKKNKRTEQEHRPYSTLDTKINLKWTTGLSIRTNCRISQRKKNLCDFGLGKDFLSMVLKAWSTKEKKIDKFDFIKMKNFSFSKNCENWTIKKAEHRSTDAFELWCWRRLLRVSWTARRSHQSILKDINLEYSLEGLMLKLKLQYFVTWCKELTHRKRPDAGKDWRQEEKGMIKDEMVGWHHWLNGHEFEQALGDGEEQGSLACCSPWGCKESDKLSD